MGSKDPGFFRIKPWMKSKPWVMKMLARMTLLLALKRKRVIFVLKVVHVCPQYNFSLPVSGNCYGLSNCLPESDFYLPRAMGQDIFDIRVLVFVFWTTLVQSRICNLIGWEAWWAPQWFESTRPGHMPLDKVFYSQIIVSLDPGVVNGYR